MKTIAAGVFKAKCLKILDEVGNGHESYVITKRGKPVAELVPLRRDVEDDMAFLRKTLVFENDIVAPALDPGEWEVLRDPS